VLPELRSAGIVGRARSIWRGAGGPLPGCVSDRMREWGFLRPAAACFDTEDEAPKGPAFIAKPGLPGQSWKALFFVAWQELRELGVEVAGRLCLQDSRDVRRPRAAVVCGSASEASRGSCVWTRVPALRQARPLERDGPLTGRKRRSPLTGRLGSNPLPPHVQLRRSGFFETADGTAQWR